LEVLVSKFRTQAPWEFLFSASHTTLQSYELSRLAHAANLRKEIGELLDQWVDESTYAMLARWVLEERARAMLVEDKAREKEAAETKDSPDVTASDNYLRHQAHFPRAPRSGT
jgi:hypothetical protein